MLEKAVINLLASDRLASVTARGGSIAVVRFEEEGVIKNPQIESYMENTLVNFLTRNGYQVVERDARVLIQIVHEASGNLPYTIVINEIHGFVSA